MNLLIAYLLGIFTALFNKPRQKLINSVAPEQESSDKGKHNPDVLSFIPSQLPPAPSNAENICKCCHHKMPWWKITLDVVTVLAALGAFISAAVYASITRNMWKEMQGQTRLQRQIGINTERAWVGLDVPITLDAIDISPTAIRIDGHYTVKNFGHGPALKVTQVGDFVDLDAPEQAQKREADFYCASALKFTTGTVPVGGELKQPPPFGFSLFPGQEHPELIQVRGKELPKKTARFLRFIGCVAYLDQFKGTHWTRFCMERKAGDITPIGMIPRLDFCAMYNDTDEPKP